jgi:hypothetical protein
MIKKVPPKGFDHFIRDHPENWIMDLNEAASLIEQQRNKGKGILSHQPVKKEICEEWTAATRTIVSDVFGPGSKPYRDFVAANRRIFTSFDTDPSYYLTQVVANLHRELRVLEQCVKEKQRELEAEEALRAAKGMKKAKPKNPVFLWAENENGTREVKEFLERQNFAVTVKGSDGSGRSETLWNLATQKDLSYAVVLLAASGGKGASMSADGLLVSGYLAGRLGRTRVIVLVESPQKLPEAAGFLRSFALADQAKWQAEIAADAAKA